MGVMSACIGSLSSFYPKSLEPNRTPEEVNRTAIRLLAKVPTIAAMTYKKAMGHPYMYPKNELGYVENFLHMMFGLPTEDYHVNPVMADALDKLLILHADHEQNCSTATVRIVSSSHANLYASVSAGISALWGPRHGGANQEVLEMLAAIQAEGGDVKKFNAAPSTIAAACNEINTRAITRAKSMRYGLY